MNVFVPSAAAVLTDSAGHGEGLIAWHVLDGLARRGHRLVVCAPRVELSAEPPFETIELGRGSRFESLAPFAYARAARRELDRARTRGRIDVVHWLYPAEDERLLFVPPRGLPFVVGPVFRAWPGDRTRPLRPGDAVRAALSPLARARRRASLRRAIVLAATPDARRGGRLLPPGVDADRFAPEPPRGETVLFVGRLDRRKGVPELLGAFAEVAAARPQARLVLAGDGPEREAVERRAAEPALAGRVAVLGAVPQARVPDLLRESALLCLPSHGEPYGMAILEAMAAARAVVATDAGGPRFLVGADGGRLVPVGDERALARSLAELLADPERLAETGRRNRERVERELSLERMLDRLEEVYAEVTA